MAEGKRLLELSEWEATGAWTELGIGRSGGLSIILKVEPLGLPDKLEMCVREESPGLLQDV